MTVLLYVMSFLSGAAALVYEVVWVRSLGLVFGGSHLAVTTALSVFMAGLALGSWILGRRVDRVRNPLRLYGLLEIGIAVFAVVFALLMRYYPVIYGPLARLAETDRLWLSFLRVLFATAAMIVPATLMGGTLPVLTRFVATGPRGLGRALALLYGFNTLGAVAGTLAAGFVLLRTLGVHRTMAVAVAVNLLIGLIAVSWPRGAAAAAGAMPGPRPRRDDAGRAAAGRDTAADDAAFRLVVWGIATSGFCALGYEVLWTRVLTMVVGTSVYSFAIMLVAFLSGIALGGQAGALLPRLVRGWVEHWRPAVVAFGAVQLAIGLTALATTVALRDLPAHAMRLQRLLQPGGDEFLARQATSFVLAFAFMAVPAFFMGLAVPLAGAVHARRRGVVGEAVGQVLAANTVGAMLGAAVSGFVLIYVFGIERSLQLLVAVNLGLGVAVLAVSLGRGRRVGLAASAAATLAAVVMLAAAPERFRLWNPDFFAVFRNNQRDAFATPERIRDALENTDVLYYHEGANETISVIRPKRAAQALLVDGRVECSTLPEDVQCQRTLGHLPMLAHPDPREVFVLGLGTGMTAGATSIHPEAVRITLAEIERGVLPAARTFGAYNHRVLDSPKLRLVHDDGRNFLRTTREKFDVITADPIHPWSGGAAYLYTAEYFRTAARRLAPGGVICQWLPIYELTVEELRSVVRTFSDSFEHVALWLTHYDAELLGSNAPLVFDEERLARRFADPAIAEDLAAVDMGTPREFLSYFVAGDAGVRAFARGGVVNTDDNLWLEFSAPRSQGRVELMGYNVLELTAHREPPLRYLGSRAEAAPAAKVAAWTGIDRANRAYDRAHALFLWNRWDDPEFRELLTALRREFPDHAPSRFLGRMDELARSRVPRPIASRAFPVHDDRETGSDLEITAVTMRVGRGRAVVVFVDNDAREVYGQQYLDAPEAALDARLAALAETVLDALRAAYAVEAEAAPELGTVRPRRERVAARFRKTVASLVGDDAPVTETGPAAR